MLGEAEQGLGADLDGRAGLGRIVDRVAAAGRASRNGSARAGRRALRAVPAEQGVERAASATGRRRAGACRRAAAAASRRARRAGPSSERSGIDGSTRAGEGGAAAQRLRAPRSTAAGRGRGARTPSSKRRLDRRRVGAAVLAARERIAPSRRPCAARTPPVAGSKRDLGAAVDAVGEQALDRRLRRSPRRRGCARRRRRRRPRPPRARLRAASGEAGSSRKPRPPTDASRAPEASRRFATRSGKARATQAPSRRPAPAAARRPRREPVAAASAARGRRRAGPCSPRQRRRRSSRSASLPPRPRSVSSTATSAAVAPQPRASASISMWARRGGSGSAAIGAAMGGGAAVLVERAERGQPRAAPRRARRRAADRARAGARGSATPQIAQSSSSARQVGFEDFGRVEARQACGRRFLPQADRRRPAPGAPARPARWVDRGLAGALGDQPGEAGGAVVARAAGEAAIDDDADAVEGQAGLGDRGGEDELAPARRRRRDRGALGGGIEAAVEAVEVDVRRQRAEPLGGALDLGDAGQEGEQAALALRPARGGSRRPSRPRSAAPASRPRWIERRADRRGPRFRSPARRPAARAKRAPSSVADMASRRRSGRSAACASSASARPKSLSRLRSWTSSNSTAETPASSGSAWMRLQEDAVGQDDDPGASPSACCRAGSHSRSCRRPARRPAPPSARRRRARRGGGARAAGSRRCTRARRAGPARPPWSCPRRAARRARRCDRLRKAASRSGRTAWIGRSPWRDGVNRPARSANSTASTSAALARPAGNGPSASIARWPNRRARSIVSSSAPEPRSRRVASARSASVARSPAIAVAPEARARPPRRAHKRG